MERRHARPIRAAIATAIAVACLCALPARASEAKPVSEAQRLADAAIAEYKKAEELESGWAETYDRGLALAERAIAADPKVADGYYAIFLNLGRKSERTGVAAQTRNIGRLKEMLVKAIELDPKHAHAWEARGEMLMRLPWFLGGSKGEGEQALRRSAELAPDWAKPVLRLAQYDRSRGRTDQARLEAEKARDLARKADDESLAKDAEALLSELGPPAR